MRFHLARHNTINQSKLSTQPYQPIKTLDKLTNHIIVRVSIVHKKETLSIFCHYTSRLRREQTWRTPARYAIPVSPKLSQLLQHQRTENHWQKFPCDTCGKVFARKSNLVQHTKKLLRLLTYIAMNADNHSFVNSL